MTRMSAAKEYDVIIAGAGIVGASTAWHLADSGLNVALLDAIGPAAAASGASDGSVSVASKMPGPAARLAVASLAYTEELAAPGGPLDGIFHRRPSFIFATCPEEEQALDELGTKLDSLGGLVRVIADGPGPVVLQGATPFASRMLALEGEGHMLGYAAVAAYLQVNAGRVHHLWPMRARAVEADSRGVTLLAETPQGSARELRAGMLVCALGLNSVDLLASLPLRPRAGQLIVTDARAKSPLPGLLTAASYLIQKTRSSTYSPRPPVVIDPLATGQYLIGSSREDHGDSTKTNFMTVRGLLDSAARIWPEVRQRRVIRVFAGIRAATSDGLPIVGPMPEAPRIIVATGFEGDGICLSAVIGREVARMARAEAATSSIAEDLRLLSPARLITPSPFVRTTT